MAYLVLCTYWKSTYRGVIEQLAVSAEVREAIGLSKLPNYSTLKKFVDSNALNGGHISLSAGVLNLPASHGKSPNRHPPEPADLWALRLLWHRRAALVEPEFPIGTPHPPGILWSPSGHLWSRSFLGGTLGPSNRVLVGNVVGRPPEWPDS
jgi:hypothetical protein